MPTSEEQKQELSRSIEKIYNKYKDDDYITFVLNLMLDDMLKHPDHIEQYRKVLDNYDNKKESWIRRWSPTLGV